MVSILKCSRFIQQSGCILVGGPGDVVDSMVPLSSVVTMLSGVVFVEVSSLVAVTASDAG